MIVIWQAMFGKMRTQQFAKAALHSVSHDRIADLLGHGHAEPLAQAVIGTRQKHKTGARDTQTLVRSEKITAFANSGKSFGHAANPARGRFVMRTARATASRRSCAGPSQACA